MGIFLCSLCSPSSQLHRFSISKMTMQYGGNELSYYLWARDVRNIPWKHTFHFLQIRNRTSVKPAVCVKTSMLKGLSLLLILCNLSICSPALTLLLVLLGACGFQVLESPTSLCQIFPTATLQKSNLWLSQKQPIFVSSFSFSYFPICCEIQEAKTWAREYIFIDSKACVTISEVPGWCGFDFGTTNKISSTASMCKMVARHTEVEGRSWEEWVWFNLLAFADVQGVSSKEV